MNKEKRNTIIMTVVMLILITEENYLFGLLFAFTLIIVSAIIAGRESYRKRHEPRINKEVRALSKIKDNARKSS